MICRKKGFTPTPKHHSQSLKISEGVRSSACRPTEKSAVRGFTLLEMIVVVAIIGIMASLILVNYRQGQRNYSLSGAAQTLISDIRQAQSMALAGATQTAGGVTDSGGYGILITGSGYQLFFNESVNIQASGADKGCQVAGVEYFDSGGNGKMIKSINLSGITIETTNENVFFSPPEPKTCINDLRSNPLISIKLTDSSGASKTVKTTQYGVVEY